MIKRIKKQIIDSNLINFLSIFIYINWIFRIKENRILFSNFFGKGYGDSPKYIAEALLKDKINKYDIIWVCKNNNESLPKGIKTVKKYSIKYFYYIATSKFWIFNTRTEIYFRKRKNQIYIQSWHGSLAFKRIEFDVEDKLDKRYIRHAFLDTKYTNLMLSNSEFCNQMYKRAFKYDGKIQMYGIPRNDVLVKKNKDIKNKVFNTFNISRDNKIILYAPTFRKEYKKNPYDIDFEKILNKINKESEQKWQLIIRLHPGIKETNKLISKYDNYINGNNYDDVQELIYACDLLITDYSSMMFEAMLADKPVIIYANDIDEYNSDRGSYFKFEDLPFPLAQNNKELLELIEEIKIQKITKKYNAFKEKLEINETGDASKMVKEYIDSCILKR
mgnify:CR=1 FL=1